MFLIYILYSLYFILIAFFFFICSDFSNLIIICKNSVNPWMHCINLVMDQFYNVDIINGMFV